MAWNFGVAHRIGLYKIKKGQRMEKIKTALGVLESRLAGYDSYLATMKQGTAYEAYKAKADELRLAIQTIKTCLK